MSKIGGNFLEEHVEKIVFAIVVIVCIWLLITRVLISPNRVQYEGQKHNASRIDEYILIKHAQPLESELNRAPNQPPPYESAVREFVELIDLPIRDIDINLYWPLPIHSSLDILDKRKYRIPQIGEVGEVAIEYIRAVAYVPTIEIDEQHPYEQSVCEPNDIDFVTVEAKFDFAALYRRFIDSFAGDEVKPEWRDPCLANPIFASVQLQRQELLADGSWSQWQIVPRIKIDSRKKMFEVVEDVTLLPPGGLKVQLLQFDDPHVRVDLLQPAAYKIASAKEEWFPPSLHKDYVKQQQEIEMEEMRRAREEEKLRREKEREETRQEREEAREERRGRTTEPGGRTGRYGGMYDDSLRGGDYLSGRRPTRGRSRTDRLGKGETEYSTRRKTREELLREKEEERLSRLKEVFETRSIDDFYQRLDKILITRAIELTRMREPLVFWAHDDTVEPSKSYRYRIRLGVFNPIAGTNQVTDQDKLLRNKVVLWSEFSDVTEPVDVPGTLYFFPQDVKEAAKIVTMQVCKYRLGHWYAEDFVVKPGETIGRVADFKPEPIDREKGVEEPMIDDTAPEIIDYATGAVLVDVVPVNDWSGGKSLHPRHYYDMLYSYDGAGIEHMPIKPMYWDEELRTAFNEIKMLQREPREPLRTWDSKPVEPELTNPEYQHIEYRDLTDESRTTPRRRPGRDRLNY